MDNSYFIIQINTWEGFIKINKIIILIYAKQEYLKYFSVADKTLKMWLKFCYENKQLTCKR